LTTAQARDLLASVMQRKDLDIATAIEIVTYRQHRNYAAYRSHRKRTLKRHRRYRPEPSK
jgi:hypothetical protein